MNSPARCKCGKFVRTELCPDCRKAKQAEDKTVRFLIGEVVKVKKPVVVPVDVGMCYSGE